MPTRSLLFCFLVSAASLHAQAVTGTILGTVRDSTGATVPNVAVTITSTSQGLSRTLNTDAEGNYQAPSLPTGTYAVTAEAQGFKKITARDIELRVDQKARVDLTLELGAVSESVNVAATIPLVQSDTSELGTTVAETQIRELPLNGRNFVQMTRLIPGVLRGIPGSNSDGSGSLAFRASASFAANGMRARDNNFILDGIDNNELLLSTVVIFPAPDALQEFKVQTSSYSAEFGRSLGGVVNLQIKSGSNEVHGNLYEFLRNDKLDANDWFNNRFNRARPPYRQNQFGGTLGGPVVRNRTFFFMDYQGLRVRQGQTFVSTVPSAGMRQGNFLEINRAIYDPLNQTPFVGNVIPAARQDPVGRNIITQLYPEPNNPGQRSANGQTIQNFLDNPVGPRQDDQFDIKADHQFHSRNQAFVRYSFERTYRFLPASLPHGDAGVTFGASDSLLRAQSLALNDTHTFRPSLLNEFRFGFSRFALIGAPLDYGTNLAEKVGLPGVNISDITSAFTQIFFNPADIQQLGANGNQPFLGFYDAYQWLDNVTWIRGGHSVKSGFSYTRRRRNQFNVNQATGRFTFQPQITSNCGGIASGCTINGNTGFSVATFLLGYPTTIARDYRPGITGERKYEFGAFIQDDYKVSRTLTLNLGLRYEVFSPNVEVHDRQANFDPEAARMLLAAPGAAFASGLEVGRALRVTNYSNFGPRIGLAWSALPDNRLVVRAGYGMFFNTPLTGGSSQMTRNIPFGIAQSFTTTLLPTLRLRDGIPALPALNPGSLPTGALGSTFDPLLRDGRGQNWNLNLQRQVGQDLLVEAAYVGSRGTRLLMNQNLNQAPARLGVTNIDINRPYIGRLPALRNVTQVNSRGQSWHNALQLKFTKRYARDFMFLVSYTYSKTVDIASDVENSTLDAYNFNLDRGLSNFDNRHNYTASWNYALPFARAKVWGQWEISGIALLRSGLPFTVTQAQGVLSTGTGNRPNRLGSGSLDSPTPDRWFDVAAFRATPENTATYGDAGRNILFAPGQAQFDFSIVKNTRFRERFQHQLRVELFNAFNTPQFAAPASTIGAAGAGVISALLYNTPMRQIQLAMKVSF